MRHLAPAAALALFVSACNQTATAPGAMPPAGTAPAVAGPPAGDGCSAQIDEFAAVLKNDAAAGNLARGVYARAVADLRQADTACRAGRAVQARSILAITRKNYGYPPG